MIMIQFWAILEGLEVFYVIKSEKEENFLLAFNSYTFTLQISV